MTIRPAQGDLQVAEEVVHDGEAPAGPDPPGILEQRLRSHRAGRHVDARDVTFADPDQRRPVIGPADELGVVVAEGRREDRTGAVEDDDLRARRGCEREEQDDDQAVGGLHKICMS